MQKSFENNFSTKLKGFGKQTMGNLYSSLKWIIPWGGSGSESDDSEYVEEVVAKVGDIQDGTYVQNILFIYLPNAPKV